MAHRGRRKAKSSISWQLGWAVGTSYSSNFMASAMVEGWSLKVMSIYYYIIMIFGYIFLFEEWYNIRIFFVYIFVETFISLTANLKWGICLILEHSIASIWWSLSCQPIQSTTFLIIVRWWRMKNPALRVLDFSGDCDQICPRGSLLLWFTPLSRVTYEVFDRNCQLKWMESAFGSLL